MHLNGRWRSFATTHLMDSNWSCHKITLRQILMNISVTLSIMVQVIFFSRNVSQMARSSLLFDQSFSDRMENIQNSRSILIFLQAIGISTNPLTLHHQSSEFPAKSILFFCEFRPHQNFVCAIAEGKEGLNPTNDINEHITNWLHVRVPTVWCTANSSFLPSYKNASTRL